MSERAVGYMELSFLFRIHNGGGLMRWSGEWVLEGRGLPLGYEFPWGHSTIIVFICKIIVIVVRREAQVPS